MNFLLDYFKKPFSLECLHPYLRQGGLKVLDVGCGNHQIKKNILLYTMTSGLGDYLIMADVMNKVETLLPQTRCLMAHRQSPHATLWPYGNPQDRFFNIYSPAQVARLIARLRRARREGTKIFGLQMAPGSLQGYFWYSFLKRIGALDYIVDFNLVNADIITPPEGAYILDWQLNQIKKLFKIEIPAEYYQLKLPVSWKSPTPNPDKGKKRIGIHPWSRRGKFSCFVWPFENWEKIVSFLLQNPANEIVILGRDKSFMTLENILCRDFQNERKRLNFLPSSSVPDLVTTVESLDLLISVNTAVIHIAAALHKKAVILNGPSLEMWTPKTPNQITVNDPQSDWVGYIDHGIHQIRQNHLYPNVGRIKPVDVINAITKISQAP